MTAIQNGVEINPASDTPDQINAKINAYLTAVCTPHGAIRTLNNAPYNAPVFDLGGSFDLLSIGSETATYLQSVTDLMTGGNTPYPATDAQKANMPNACGLYYNGMMMVFGLTNYVA